MIRLHPLCGFIILVSLLTGQALEMIVLFAIATWHELGHFAVAKWFGWRVREMVLLPFGGVLRVDEASSIPIYQEILVTLAGPCQHLWLIVGSYVLVWIGWLDGHVAEIFVHANLVLLVFNLLPVAPLDGGKLFAALCSYWLPYYEVLRWSAGLSLTIGVIGASLCVVHWSYGGLVVNLLVISSFVIYSNWQALKYLSYQFRRHLLYRMTCNSPTYKPIVATEIDEERLVRKLVREKQAIIYVGNRVITETSLLRLFWQAKTIASKERL